MTPNVALRSIGTRSKIPAERFFNLRQIDVLCISQHWIGRHSDSGP